MQNHNKNENAKKQNRHERINPQVASLWLTLDDVDETNGGMEILSFTSQPESRHQNVPEDFILNSGGDTKGFDNFNLTHKRVTNVHVPFRSSWYDKTDSNW